MEILRNGLALCRLLVLSKKLWHHDFKVLQRRGTHPVFPNEGRAVSVSVEEEEQTQVERQGVTAYTMIMMVNP